MNEVIGPQALNLSAASTHHKSSEETLMEIQTHSIFERMLESPLFWTSIVAKASAAFSYAVWNIPSFYLPILKIGSISSALFLGSSMIMDRNKLFYEISLGYNYIINKISPDKWPKYNQITTNLFLGRLPLKNANDHKELIEKENIGAVLSVVENFENHILGIFSDPVTTEDWKQLGVNHYQIETPDFKPLSEEDIDRGVKFIEAEINKGKKVYVHCKAGRSRSAAVVVAYLVKSRLFDTIDKAIEYVREKRKVVSLDESKTDAIKKYFIREKISF